MNHDLFEERLLPWIDGELPAAQADEMAAHVQAHPELAERVEAERRFEEQFRASLLRTVEPEAEARMRALLEAARPVEADSASASVQAVAPAAPLPPAPARILRLLRPLTAVAAAVLMTISLSWFYCIGPFECGYLQAVERVATERDGTPTDAIGIPGYVTEAETILAAGGYHSTGDVLVTPMTCPHHGAFDLVVCSDARARPSFRRRVELDGVTWWIGDENGRTFVAFVHPTKEQLVWLIGEQPRDELLAIARDVRSKSF